MPKKQTKPKAKKNVKKKIVVKKRVAKKKITARKVSIKKRVQKKKTKKRVTPKGSVKTKKQIRKRTAIKKPAKKRVSKELPGKRIKVKVSKSVIEKKPEQSEKVISRTYLIIEPFDFDDTLLDDFFAQLELTPEEEYYQQINGMTHLQKTTIMYVAVISVMVVIVGFWFVGIRNGLSQNFVQTSSISEDEMTARRDVQTAFFDIQNEIDSIGNQVEDKQDIIMTVAEEAKQQIIEDKLREDAADKLKEKIENFDSEPNINQ